MFKEAQILEERRKSKRFRIPFNLEFIPSDNSNNYVPGEVRDFSPDGFSFEAKNIDLGTDKIMKVRFLVDKDSGYINVLGRIIWKIQVGVECQVGIEINEIDIGSNEDLGYPFDMWKDKIKTR